MISHRQVMKKIGEAVRDSSAVLDYCRAHFGRGLAVNVGAYPEGIAEAADSPFLWIQPVEQNEEIMTDETFTVQLIVGGLVRSPDGRPVVENVVTPRTETANGLTVNGGNEIVENLRDLIIGIVVDARAGAIVSRVRRDENDISHFPLEWARFFVDYFEPESLTEN